jgi:exodeoxyribonuclease V beta subunit
VSAAVVECWQDLPLEGRSLVEASAGTGKTWTITLLYLRLLLERGFGAREVVVTTFTEAAAQELRERLRARLDWAEAEAQAWREGGHSHARGAGEAPELRWLRDTLALEPLAADGRPDGTALHRLRLARAELDLAPIGTIHSLCRRVLADHPLESGGAPVPVTVVDAEALREELIDDLWRRWTQGEAEPPAGARDWIASGRDGLRRSLKLLDLPQLELRLPPSLQEIAQRMDRGQVPGLRALARREGFFHSVRTPLPRELEALASFIEAGDPAADPGRLDKLLAGAPENQFKKGLHAAAHAEPALQFALALAGLLGNPVRNSRHRALAAAHDELLERRSRLLAERDATTFDEMIERVRAATAQAERPLATLLARQWRAALVDECQDTDRRQYAIFDALFAPPHPQAGRTLVLIGDPKQAIYGFRGGDIHTYLRAAGDAGNSLRLSSNQRSSTAFVAALNQFYAAAGDGLLHPGIQYTAVAAAGRADATPLAIAGKACAQPLVIHDWPDDADLPRTAAVRERLALAACADAIAGLLADAGQRIGDRALEPGDIAVLLPKNHQVAALRALLQVRGVPCVGQARSSVWRSDWAWALQVVLYAALRPEEPGAVRAALATRLFGVDYPALRALAGDSDRWRAQVERFHDLHAAWRSTGVLAVVRRLIEDAAPRLLGEPDGERALTDLRHLGELLAAEGVLRHGMDALWAWFAAQRRAGGAGDDDAAEAQRLRIESDARRVQLMTLHGSKGLEFNLVFLPLMWMPARSSPITIPLVHDPESGSTVADLGSPGFDAACIEARIEDQRERARLLYVALTRARHACHVFALPRARPAGSRNAPTPDPERSPLDVLLARIESGDGAAAMPAVEWRRCWPSRATRTRITEAAAPGPAELPSMPAERAPRGLFSFTQLVRGGSRGAGADDAAADETLAVDADASAADESPEPPDPELALLVSAAGADFGNALHAVMERRVLGLPLAQQLALVRRSLQEYDVRAPLPAELLASRIAARLDAVIEADLGGGLRLADLGPAAQRAEMGFDFVLEGAGLQLLREACAAHGAEALLPAALGQRVLRGMMTGKIDLVLRAGERFHVLDYKSNRLGERLSDYAPERLQAAMDEHHYRLQALLYCVALHRHLRTHLDGYDPRRHLGAPLYLFVRAVGLAPMHGIWRGDFGVDLLQAVDAALAHGAVPA